MLAERFRNLIYAIQLHGAKSGIELQLTNDPELHNLPLVFDALRLEDRVLVAVVMTFPPVDPFINSDVISFVVREMRRAETLSAKPILLFLDQHIPQVERALTYSGLARHATTFTYTRTKRGFEMEWRITEPSTHSPACPGLD